MVQWLQVNKVFTNSQTLGIVMGLPTRDGLQVRVGRVQVQVWNLQPWENPYLWHGFVRVWWVRDLPSKKKKID